MWICVRLRIGTGGTGPANKTDQTRPKVLNRVITQQSNRIKQRTGLNRTKQGDTDQSGTGGTSRQSTMPTATMTGTDALRLLICEQVKTGRQPVQTGQWTYSVFNSSN